MDERSEAIRKVRVMRASPDIFIEKILECTTLEDFQRIICKLFAEYDRLNIIACHSVGKTFIMARLSLAFLYLYVGSKVITTAPTHRQVVTLLWGEIRKAKRTTTRYLEGKVLEASIKIDDDHFAMGFSPKKGAATDSKEQQDSSFQGYHAPYMLIVFDEATGITRDMYTMAEGLTTSGKIVKWVCIGNPTSRAGEFYKNTKKAEWYTHKITCFDSPNMKANGFTNKAKLRLEINKLKKLSDNNRLERIKNYLKPNINLINAQWVLAKVYQWGFDHPLTKSKAFGEFPDTEDNVIIKYESVQAAFNRDIETEKFDKRRIGVDVARFGVDSTVLTEIKGNKLVEKEVHNQKRTTEVTGDVIALFRKNDDKSHTDIVVDATGIGSGVVDELIEAQREGTLPDYVTIHEVHNAQSIEHPDPEKQKELQRDYENLKAYMFQKLNEDLRDELDIPSEEIYEEELPAILFKYSKRGKLIVESKEDFKARYGKSPDTADSLALANLGKYLRPKYGSFSAIAKTTIPSVLSKRTTKNNKDRKSRVKAKEY